MNSIRIIVKYLLLALVVAPILLSGCKKSEACISEGDRYIEIKFTQEDSDTRAEIGDDGSGFFTDGDKVGLYIYGKQTKHVILTREGGQWTPKLLKSELGAGRTSFRILSGQGGCFARNGPAYPQCRYGSDRKRI